MGNDLKQKILAQNGIISEDEAQSKSTVLKCGRCQIVNSQETKYCISCSYPLTPLAYEEIKAAENERIKNLELKYEQDMKLIRQQMGSIFMTLEKLRDQEDINMFASALFKSGQLKSREAAEKDRHEEYAPLKSSSPSS
jgi:hypothetical protein